MAVDKLVDSTQLDNDLTTVANAIRNKRGISNTLLFPSEFVTEINNITSVEKKSGSVVNFNAAEVYTIPQMEIDIDPVQSGTGDPAPDNVRPITGWTGIKLTRTGVNLLDENGLLLQSWNKYGLPNTLKPLTTYRFSVFGETTFSYRLYMTSTPTASGVDVSLNRNYMFSGQSQTFTTPENMEAYPYLKIGANASGGGLDTTAQLQISVGGAVTSYAPYTSADITIDFPTPPGTVYGGTLDLTTGVLTVTYGNIASYNGETLPGEWISDRDVYSPGGTPTTGAQVVYELASPQTYQLAPEQLSVNYYKQTWTGASGESIQLYDTQARNAFILMTRYTKATTHSATDGLLTNYGTSNIFVSNTTQAASADDNNITIKSTSYDSTTIYLFAPPSAIADVAALRAYLANSPLEIQYPVETPFNYELYEKDHINTLIGVNNIWADTGDIHITVIGGL